MDMLNEQAACKSKQQVCSYRSDASKKHSSKILQLLGWVYGTATLLKWEQHQAVEALLTCRGTGNLDCKR